MTDHDTAAVLTEAQVEAGATQLYALGVIVPEGVSYADAVQQVARALAAQPPQDDPQPDEREALAALFATHLPGDYEHLFLDTQGDRTVGVRCRCGWVQPRGVSHDAHLADVVLAAGFRCDPDAGLREREAVEASREQVHDLLELLDGERRQHANALVMAWAEGYGSGSSEATDDWVRPGTARRRRNPYLLDRVAAHDNDSDALSEPTPGSES